MPADGAEGHSAFLADLAEMSSKQRLDAARRGAFDRTERAIWASAYPDEVPLVNGELEWIALGLADLD
jgi:Ser/Thr protein kinase RdoA (MazF antagonist)